MKFSIIIPVYNVAPYLRACLDSILAQTFEDWEAICVDDGSTDESGAIVDEYVARDKRFRVIHKENGGEGSARNAGLEVANGEWLVYLDSDDIISRTILYDFAEIIERVPEVDMVRCRTVVFKDGENPIWSGTDKLKIVDMSTIIPDDVSMFGVTEIAYRSARFGKVRFTNHKIGADLIYTSKCFAIANMVVDFDKVNYGYRIRNGSMAHQPDTPERVNEKIDFLKKLFQNLEGSNKLIGKRLARCRLNMWLEMCANTILLNPNSKKWQVTWDIWLESISNMRLLSCLSLWQRVVAGILVKTRSRFLAKVLCALPHRLKTAGLHR